jgi:hypothetical protein
MHEQTVSTMKDRRCSPRAHVNELARLRPNDWSAIQVEVLNFSAGGFRATCDATLKIHSYVSLEVPGFGVVSAKIVWCKEGQFGGRFVQPIDPRLCAWLQSAEDEQCKEPAPEVAKNVASRLSDRARLKRIGSTPVLQFTNQEAKLGEPDGKGKDAARDLRCNTDEVR